MGSEDIWTLAEMAAELNKEPNETTTDDDSFCKHKNYFFDSSTYENICIDCGSIIFSNISNEPEWNNYRDECGNYSKNTQRADMYVSDNPYQTGECCIINFKNNRFLMRLQYQQAFTHKQKTFWQTGLTLERVCGILNLKHDCLATAKNLWYVCMESGKLTRASVREGLIASCLYYACIHNKIPIERDEIIKAFGCTTKCLSKGEKVICQILDVFPHYHHLIYNNINIDKNDSFIRHCSNLGVPFSVSNECKEIFEKNKIKLQAVTPKSAIGGVIAYTIKEKLKYKIPTKSQISKMVDVCTPTINKVIELIKKDTNN